MGNTDTWDFFESAIMGQTDACVEWPFSVNHGGYARIRVDGVEHRVHRMVCEEVYGTCPPHLRDAAHRCGNRRCINPRHLRWASRAGNAADEIEHGTDNRGAKHPKAILAEAQVRKLRRAYHTGKNISEIARAWGVNIHTATNAARGRTWKWLLDHDL